MAKPLNKEIAQWLLGILAGGLLLKLMDSLPSQLQEVNFAYYIVAFAVTAFVWSYDSWWPWLCRRFLSLKRAYRAVAVLVIIGTVMSAAVIYQRINRVRPETVLTSYLQRRSIAFVAPSQWNDSIGDWLFAIEHMGQVALQNVHIRAIPMPINSSPLVKLADGIDLNPQTSRGFIDKMWRIPHVSPDHRIYSIYIDDSANSVIQELHLVRIKPDSDPSHPSSRWARASRVVDQKSHQVLLACKDVGVTRLNDSWERYQMPACEEMFLFRINALIPETMEEVWNDY